MMKLILSTLTACALCFGAVAQDDQDDSLFDGKEVSISLSTVFTVENGTFGDYDFNLQAGVGYFFTKYFGAEVNLPFYVNDGVSVREISAGGLFRVPLHRNVAPYLGVGSVYRWQDENFDYYAKVGTAFRLNPKWELFGEGVYRVDDFNKGNLNNGSWAVVTGLRLNF